MEENEEKVLRKEWKDEKMENEDGWRIIKGRKEEEIENEWKEREKCWEKKEEMEKDAKWK